MNTLPNSFTEDLHDTQMPIIRKSLAAEPWYRRAWNIFGEKPYLAPVTFLALVLVAAGIINIAACIF